MVEMFNSDPNWIKNVITGEETWVYGYDPGTKRQSSQWLEPGEPRFKKARMIISKLKCLLIAFFDVKGLVHYQFVPEATNSPRTQCLRGQKTSPGDEDPGKTITTRTITSGDVVNGLPESTLEDAPVIQKSEECRQQKMIQTGCVVEEGELIAADNGCGTSVLNQIKRTEGECPPAWQRRSQFIKLDVEHQTRLDQLMDFLEREILIQQNIQLAKGGFQSAETSDQERRKGFYKKKNDIPTVTGLQQIELGGCIFCEKKHASQNCFAAKKMSLEEKRKVIREKKVCFKCLKGRHLARYCRTRVRCYNCGSSHFLIMCTRGDRNNKEAAQLGIEPEFTNQNSERVKQRVSHRENSESFDATVKPNEDLKRHNDCSNQVCQRNVALQTLMLNVIAPKGRKLVRAFFDSGSQHTYILKTTAEELGLKPVTKEIVHHALFGGMQTTAVTHNLYDIQLKADDENFVCKVTVRDQSKICQALPRIPKTSLISKELEQRKIKVTDLGNDNPPIELLIGVDIYGKLMTGKTLQLDCGLTAMLTHFGWTFLGSLKEWSDEDNSMLVMSINTMFGDSRQDFSISQLWDLDTIGVRDPVEVKSSVEQKTAFKNEFVKNISRNRDGRYVVPLPWIEGHPPLPTNEIAAHKRMGRRKPKKALQSPAEKDAQAKTSQIPTGASSASPNSETDNQKVIKLQTTSTSLSKSPVESMKNEIEGVEKEVSVKTARAADVKPAQPKARMLKEACSAPSIIYIEYEGKKGAVNAIKEKKELNAAVEGGEGKETEAAWCGAGIEQNQGPRMSKQTTLETSLDRDKEIKDLINALTKRLDSWGERLESRLSAIDDRVENINQRLQQLEESSAVTKAALSQNSKKIKDLEDQLEYLDAKSRERNLIFYGIEQDNNEDCRERIRKVIEENMQTTEKINITRCHRSSRKPGAPILVEVPEQNDRSTLFKAAFNLRGTRISLSKDYSMKMREQRRVLNIKRRELVEKGTLAKLRDNKLIINGIAYKVCDGQIVDANGHSL
ncbi:hypothetical protein LAZ67_2003230 [Cordylochernes scorpioides]|uniref:CCHC-type domain-containing protein n=1 Tax=Cordylochernes scorpioides TaxID=51811 RepID=A0ABY6K3E4_9ARAC|nr:hypothetical protein LAZ67_2003230 [Cordylochernes scorpioides]